MDDKEEMDPFLEEIVVNLDNFIENINCLRETFGYSEVMLRQQNISATKSFNDLVKDYTSQDENGENINIPSEKKREFKKLLQKKQEQKKLPNSFLLLI